MTAQHCRTILYRPEYDDVFAGGGFYMPLVDYKDIPDKVVFPAIYGLGTPGSYGTPQPGSFDALRDGCVQLVILTDDAPADLGGVSYREAKDAITAHKVKCLQAWSHPEEGKRPLDAGTALEVLQRVSSAEPVGAKDFNRGLCVAVAILIRWTSNSTYIAEILSAAGIASDEDLAGVDDYDALPVKSFLRGRPWTNDDDNNLSEGKEVSW